MEPTIVVDRQEAQTVLTITPPGAMVMAVVGAFTNDEGGFIADTAAALPTPTDDEQSASMLEVTAAMLTAIIRVAAIRIKVPPDALHDRIGADLFTGKMGKPWED